MLLYVCVAHVKSSGVSSLGDGGQTGLITSLTSLAHRAVAALGLGAEPQGKAHGDPDAGYRAICHVGIQLHFGHGSEATACQGPASAVTPNQDSREGAREATSAEDICGGGKGPAPPFQPLASLRQDAGSPTALVLTGQATLASASEA